MSFPIPTIEQRACLDVAEMVHYSALDFTKQGMNVPKIMATDDKGIASLVGMVLQGGTLPEPCKSESLQNIKFLLAGLSIYGLGVATTVYDHKSDTDQVYRFIFCNGEFLVIKLWFCEQDHD
jgi:hypothetical protein